MRRTVLLVFLIVVASAAGLWYWYSRPRRPADELPLYGNVDLRQVQLAFNNSDRIAEVLVQEGDRIERGQMVARLDTRRLEPQVAQSEAKVAAQRQVVARHHHGSRPEEIAQAKAQVEAQRAVVERLRNGTRPEEIAEARANVESTKADASNARLRYERVKGLSAVRLPNRAEVQAVSQQDIDDAKAALEVAEAKLLANQKALELAIAGPRKEEIAESEAKLAMYEEAYRMAVEGPRKEDVAQAEAQLRADEAQLALLKQQMADAVLFAPANAVVRSRLLEPGEMATPMRPVYSVAITDPKWVRAYVAETDLGKVRQGMTAKVVVDSFPGRQFEGWVGFISPVAEFTPKTVQTEELRTSLVYEVRVFVKDPSDVLRLGMPATAWLPLSRAEPKSEAGR